MTQTTSARPRARTFAFVGAFVAVLAVAAACSESRRANGDSCLKDEDCLSGICAAQVCVAASTPLDAAVNGEGGKLDASIEASEGGADGTAQDSGTKETGPEAAQEAATDSGSPGDGPSGEGATD